MTEERTPPATAIERRQQLLETIRRSGGTWDWQRARETYEPRPDPRTVRRDLQQLYKAGSLVRAESGGYEAA